MTKDELMRFCGKDDIRFYLCDINSRDAWTYASDGHICVRIPRIEGEPDGDENFTPKAEKLFENFERFTHWVPVPECKAPEMIDCLICHGTGDHECSCGHEHTCPDCDGSGKVDGPTLPIKIGDSFFGDKFLALIQGWEISVTGGMEAAGIRGDGAQGLLMPRREGLYE